jgi:predicted nucleic acid-binding protein
MDSSALAKLVLIEPESAALDMWLKGHGGAMISSELSRVEVMLTCRRREPSALGAAQALLSARVDLIRMTIALLDDAARVTDPLLRTLDAIHLASAQSMSDALTGFVTYDRRMFAAAQAADLTPTSPGLP